MPLAPPALVRARPRSRPATLALLALPLLAACGDDGLNVYVGDRVVYSTVPAAAAAPAATATTAAAPAAPPRPRYALSTNVPVYLGDRLISPGTPDPDD